MPEPKGIHLTLPGGGRLDLRYLLLDLNGTLARDGRLLPGVAEAVARVAEVLEVRLLTADTFGTAGEVARALGARLETLPAGRPGGPRKAEAVQSLGPEGVAAMGNGVNDAPMLRLAALGIAVLGPEGCAREALEAARILVKDPLEGLELFLYPDRLVATLRP
ncbi:MAG: HAD family hydrolase [Acidobacteriota bacterium]